MQKLIKLRERKGRLILIGIGGSLANCSHAVNDFRKLCSIKALHLQITYLNLAQELMMTAGIVLNDEGMNQ